MDLTVSARNDLGRVVKENLVTTPLKARAGRGDPARPGLDEAIDQTISHYRIIDPSKIAAGASASRLSPAEAEVVRTACLRVWRC